MKVKDLIEKLESFPEDMEVRFEASVEAGRSFRGGNTDEIVFYTEDGTEVLTLITEVEEKWFE